MCVYFVRNRSNRSKRAHVTDDCQQENAVARVDRRVCSDCFNFVFRISRVFYAALASCLLLSYIASVCGSSNKLKVFGV